MYLSSNTKYKKLIAQNQYSKYSNTPNQQTHSDLLTTYQNYTHSRAYYNMAAITSAAQLLLLPQIPHRRIKGEYSTQQNPSSCSKYKWTDRSFLESGSLGF